MPVTCLLRCWTAKLVLIYFSITISQIYSYNRSIQFCSLLKSRTFIFHLKDALFGIAELPASPACIWVAVDKGYLNTGRVILYWSEKLRDNVDILDKWFTSRCVITLFRMVHNLRTVNYFWNFAFNTFRSWLLKIKNMDKGATTQMITVRKIISWLHGAHCSNCWLCFAA